MSTFWDSSNPNSDTAAPFFQDTGAQSAEGVAASAVPLSGGQETNTSQGFGGAFQDTGAGFDSSPGDKGDSSKPSLDTAKLIKFGGIGLAAIVVLFVGKSLFFGGDTSESNPNEAAEQTSEGSGEADKETSEGSDEATDETQPDGGNVAIDPGATPQTTASPSIETTGPASTTTTPASPGAAAGSFEIVSGRPTIFNSEENKFEPGEPFTVTVTDNTDATYAFIEIKTRSNKNPVSFSQIVGENQVQILVAPISETYMSTVQPLPIEDGKITLVSNFAADTLISVVALGR